MNAKKYASKTNLCGKTLRLTLPFVVLAYWLASQQAFAQSACRNENLGVVNHTPDDIIEIVGATFEQTLQFNVDANQLDNNVLREVITLNGRVADELVTGGNRGRCDIATHSRKTDHRVSLHTQVTPQPWELGELNSLRYPQDLVAFALEDAVLEHVSTSTLAAGGLVSLEHGNVQPDWFLRKPGKKSFALLGGSDINIRHAHIAGTVYHGGALNVYKSHLRDSRVAANPIDFQKAKKFLEKLSTELMAAPANGQVEMKWGGVQLLGTDSSVNVFHLDTSQLEEAKWLTVNVPRGSVVLLNLKGERLHQERSVLSQLHGLSNRLLINFTGSSIALRHGALRATLLAAFAGVELEHIHVQGTLIARALKLRSTHLAFSQFTGWELLPYARGVDLVGADSLFSGCEYTLSIPAGVPLTTDGDCLAEPLRMTYLVRGKLYDAFQGETTNAVYSAFGGDVTAFDLKPDVQLLPGQMFERFARRLHLRAGVDSLELDPSLPVLQDDLPPEHMRLFYQHFYRGLPVLGRGYNVVVNESGHVVSVNGHFEPLLTLAVTPSVAQDTALAAARIALENWSVQLSSQGLSIHVPSPSEELPPRLVWAFENPSRPTEKVAIDALDGSIAFLGVTALEQLSGPEPTGAFTIEASPGAVVQTRHHGIRSIDLELWSQPTGNPLFYAFSLDKPPFSALTEFGMAHGVSVLGAPENKPLEQREPQFYLITSNRVEGNNFGLDADMLAPARSVYWALQQCIKYFKDEDLWLALAPNPDTMTITGKFRAVLVEDWEELREHNALDSETIDDLVDTNPLGVYPTGQLGTTYFNVNVSNATRFETVCHEYAHGLASRLGALERLSGEGDAQLTAGKTPAEARVLSEGLADLRGRSKTM
jgi:choice-of-anchor A domain-containing protein